ncbi:[FeFe] hydrogenase H-cluster maturation GTPase HydF [Selenomonas sp. TAMA-11512]|uniref:[FeFe] hydrogenase H-cluster maturation GTPase HydF n=1 Tax=Selenomonas sp. TAMA-11512 TaxID=3095337 RepID=UPI0030850BF2|nr:[FeFe] hydrogenase H-cluster maturation GTPase HydF [Selenomonas sp. TAMA-11512]
MSLTDTPTAERTIIAFFGRTNVGKSSLINALTEQSVSIVSPAAGTTTDPVRKTMELLPIGPVELIDTAGLDDATELGELRRQKTQEILRRTDIAILVVEAGAERYPLEEDLIQHFQNASIPYLLVHNKVDRLPCCPTATDPHSVCVSAEKKLYLNALKERIAHLHPTKKESLIVSDLLRAGDLTILVTPIDSSAPKGRLILPQQLVLRDLLDHHLAALVTQPEELPRLLQVLCTPPALIVTDSQVFGKVRDSIPSDLPLTSFSILMARHKGYLAPAIRGIAALDALRDGDTVLMAEGCTHHRQCGDIGTVKLPNWIRKHTGKELRIETSSGHGFPDDLSPYKLIIHCGACMLQPKEMLYRVRQAEVQQIPITNYGTAIAHLNGILKRSLDPFPELLSYLAR